MSDFQAYSDAPEHRRSRTFARRSVLLALGIATTSAAAQQPDSLAERLRRAEAAIAALQVQVAEQSGAAVQTRSRVRLEWNGRVLMNAFGNSRRVNNVDNPQFVAADPAAGEPIRGGGMAIRQTRLGLVITVPEVLGGSFTGDVDVDFNGGQVPSGGGRTFPLLRLRTARGIVRWGSAQLMLGQESPLISDVDPVTVTAVGSPSFAAAGNLWLWLPQVRGGYEYGGRVRVGVQGSVLAPTSGDPAAFFDTDNDIAERSQRPYLQARASVSWGDDIRSEVGCGVHQGWLLPGADRVDSEAFACDLVVPATQWMELRGEFFAGQALRGLGGGGIGQNFRPGNLPLRTRGGWAQLNLRPIPAVSFGAGCGTDQPESGGGVTRQRNDVCTGYAMLRSMGPLFVGAEYRKMRTRHAAGPFTNDHVTLATGFEF